MRKLAAVFLLVILSSTIALSKQDGARRLEPRGKAANRAAAQAGRTPAIEDAVLGYYISQFPQVAEVGDDVFVKVLPHLRQFVRERFEISQRRNRALNAIRNMVQRDESEEDLKRLIREFDKADADIQANQEKFLANVDPLLSTHQQAKARLFLMMADNRIRQILNQIQNSANRAAQPAPDQREK
ncbi:MAG: hypothetical protein AUI54_02270 [Acidobacteria bacterium 13_1_40CM_2_56_5]|nr:MAG: hypothetical protein AUI54_02270 [Acidobacteria bacterium 13_1_40CM_2_56_5]